MLGIAENKTSIVESWLKSELNHDNVAGRSGPLARMNAAVWWGYGGLFGRAFLRQRLEVIAAHTQCGAGTGMGMNTQGDERRKKRLQGG